MQINNPSPETRLALNDTALTAQGSPSGRDGVQALGCPGCPGNVEEEGMESSWVRITEFWSDKASKISESKP